MNMKGKIPLIEMKGIYKSFGYVEALKNLNFTIYKKVQPRSFMKPTGSSFSVLAASTSLQPKKHLVYGFLPYWT